MVRAPHCSSAAEEQTAIFLTVGNQNRSLTLCICDSFGRLQALARKFEDSPIALTPGHSQLARFDFPALRRADEVVCVVAADRLHAVPLFFFKLFLPPQLSHPSPPFP